MKKQLIFTAALAALTVCIPVGAYAASADAGSAERITETDPGTASFSISRTVDENADEGTEIAASVVIEDKDGQTVSYSPDSLGNLTAEETEELTDLLSQHMHDTEMCAASGEDALDEAQQAELDANTARIDELMKKSGLMSFSFANENGDEISYVFSDDDNDVDCYLFDDDSGTLTISDEDMVIEDGCVSSTITVSDDSSSAAE